METNWKFRGKRFFLTYPRCGLDPQVMLDSIKAKFESNGGKVLKYIVAKEEHQDGSPHRHVFIELEMEFRQTHRSSFLDVEGYHCNIEHVRSGKAVAKYCKKEGDFISNMKSTEVSMSRDDIAKELMSGKPLKDLVAERPSLLFGYAKLKGDIQCFEMDKGKPKALDTTCGLWIAGPAGCGKTTIATSRYGDYYIKDKTKWWNGYGGEPTVLADDVDITWREILSYFKYWADKFPFKGETKGGMVELRPSRFIVTSNKTLEELLELCNWPKDDYEPYQRRFKQFWITSIDDFDEQL